MNFILTCMWTSSYSSIIVEDTIFPLIVGVLPLLKVTIFMNAFLAFLWYSVGLFAYSFSSSTLPCLL